MDKMVQTILVPKNTVENYKQFEIIMKGKAPKLKHSWVDGDHLCLVFELYPDPIKLEVKDPKELMYAPEYTIVDLYFASDYDVLTYLEAIKGSKWIASFLYKGRIFHTLLRVER